MSLIEKLANIEHNRWSGWMKYLFEKSTTNKDGTVTIPAGLSERWKRQMNTTYADLPDEEKPSDIKEAIISLKFTQKWYFLRLIIILLIIIGISVLYQYYHHIQGTDCGCLVKYFGV